jgi:hypothetical protein
MAEDICASRSSKVLLVEGRKDCRVIFALQEHHRITDHFGIHQCNGEDGVLKRFNALILSPPDSERPSVIGVVLDADTARVEDRWRQFYSRLLKYGYDLPAEPDPNGTVIEKVDQYPRVGLWLMPDNKTIGMLEDFLLKTVTPAGVEVARQAVDLAQSRGVATFRNPHYSKALIHTFLSWQDEPGYPLGLAVTAKVLSAECEISNLFVSWLRKLFE